MIVEERHPWIVRHKIEPGFPVSAQHDPNLDDARLRLAGDANRLEAVPVQM